MCGRLPVVPVWGSIVETEGANELGRLGMRVDGFRFPENKTSTKFLDFLNDVSDNLVSWK